MRLAAIILNYYGHRDTIECVNSIVCQNVKTIVVVDNSGEKQEEAALREAFKGKEAVRLIATGKNLGFAGGVNEGLRRLNASNYDAFLFLNNDTLAPPDMVERLVDGAREAGLDLASPVIRCYPETHRIWSVGNYYNIPTAMISTSPIKGLPRNFYYLTGCCLMIRRGVLETIGAWDERFFFYGEDVDLCARAARQGFRMGVVANALVYHKVSASAVPNSEFYEYHLNLGHFMLAGRLTPGRLNEGLSFVVKLFSLGTRAVVRTIRYRNQNAMNGYLKAVRRFLIDVQG